MDIAQNRRTIVRAVAGGVAATAAVAGLVSVGAGTASAAPQVYSKTFTVRYHPTPQSAVLGAEIALYYFNSVRLNGNQGCVAQPNPVVKPDTPVGWTATISALCSPDAGTARSGQPVTN